MMTEKERIARIAWLEANYPRVFLEASQNERAIEWRRLTAPNAASFDDPEPKPERHI